MLQDMVLTKHFYTFPRNVSNYAVVVYARASYTYAKCLSRILVNLMFEKRFDRS